MKKDLNHMEPTESTNTKKNNDQKSVPETMNSNESITNNVTGQAESKSIPVGKYDEKMAELEIQLEDANKKIKELQDKWLRSEADLDNFRKRVNKEKVEWREFYHEEILEEILPVLDNFDRALLTNLEGEEARKFAEGIILVDKQLHEILSKHGLNEIESVGKPFNPHFHEAIMTIETEEHPENTVVEEVRKGYLREDKVIRPAMVKVSKTKQEISE